MKQILHCLAILCIGTSSFAQDSLARTDDWILLNNDEINLALTSRKLKYKSASQTFQEDGRTKYYTHGESLGYWKARGDKYCSQWPPNSAWACYGLEAHLDGTRVRFIDTQGGYTVGTYVLLK